MADGLLARVNYLTFDIFGTVMDLTGSLAGPAGEFLAAHGSELTAQSFTPSGGPASGLNSTRTTC